MLDEEAYKGVRREATRLNCPFEKAILSRCGQCRLSLGHNIAEREAVSCSDALARSTCVRLSDLLHEKALFALKLQHAQEIPHAKEMRIQCGGLSGIGEAAGASTDELHALVQRAIELFGSLEELPYSEIVKSIAAFSLRKRRQ